MTICKFAMPNFYVPPFDHPLYWRDEQSGILPDAVTAYLFRNEGLPPTELQIEILRRYLDYYINAPCWALTGSTADEFDKLRADVKVLDSCAAIDKWIFEALEVGIDLL